jgi:hypothetical protein
MNKFIFAFFKNSGLNFSLNPVMIAWNNINIKNLFEIGHDVNYVDKFRESKNNGRKIRVLWKIIASEIDAKLS